MYLITYNYHVSSYVSPLSFQNKMDDIPWPTENSWISLIFVELPVKPRDL